MAGFIPSTMASLSLALRIPPYLHSYASPDTHFCEEPGPKINYLRP